MKNKLFITLRLLTLVLPSCISESYYDKEKVTENASITNISNKSLTIDDVERISFAIHSLNDLEFDYMPIEYMIFSNNDELLDEGSFLPGESQEINLILDNSVESLKARIQQGGNIIYGLTSNKDVKDIIINQFLFDNITNDSQVFSDWLFTENNYFFVDFISENNIKEIWVDFYDKDITRGNWISIVLEVPNGENIYITPENLSNYSHEPFNNDKFYFYGILDKNIPDVSTISSLSINFSNFSNDVNNPHAYEFSDSYRAEVNSNFETQDYLSIR